MTSLTEILYPLPDYRRTPLSLLVWWESRRLLYNAVVGATGVFSLGMVVFFGLLPPRPAHFAGLWMPVVAYALLANLCYSSGWLLELSATRLWGRAAPEVGPLLFRQGLIFSVGLTLLPIVMAVLSWLIRIARVL